ncbi:MAG: dihydroneopterin aldolase [Opitutales bacterium]|nr:dihydroneopterin aldolase [Opitutales bacterium]
MDELIIEKLKLKGKHGCFAEERNEFRDFEVSMRLFFDAKVASKTDALEDTIDYPQAMAIAEGVLAGESVRLIEKLADMIAERLFVRFEILQEVEIEVAKLGVDVGFEFSKISTKMRRCRTDYIK